MHCNPFFMIVYLPQRLTIILALNYAIALRVCQSFVGKNICFSFRHFLNVQLYPINWASLFPTIKCIASSGRIYQ